MEFIKRYRTLLGINIGLIFIFIACMSWNIHVARVAQKEALLAKQSLDLEVAVITEQNIQDKPVEPHTVEEQKIPIFVYHSVRPHLATETKLQDAYDITPELFEQQLTYLRDNGYHAITPGDLFVDASTSKVVTNVVKPVMLTFDDGLRNQYEYAYPLLKKYKTKAIFYIYTNPLEVGSIHFLTWNDVKEMKAGGMVIGSHTLHHPHMKRLPDDVLRHEIFDSKKILETRLGSPIDDFATPYGYSDDRIASVVKDAGYRTSRTLFRGSYHKDMFTLKGYLAHDAFKDFVFLLNSKE